MPLLHIPYLPSLERVAGQGLPVINQPVEGAVVLRIGLLNMMPDRALAATERQFFNLLGRHEPCCSIELLSIKGVPRGEEGTRHQERYYRDCHDIQTLDLDALVITGANITESDLTHEPFWEALSEVLQWAEKTGTPSVCSCLAAHASVKIFHGLTRNHLKRKCWGVFTHQVCMPDHPLVANFPKSFDMPHSRFNDISETQFQSHGMDVLAVSPQAGVQIAAETDNRRIYLQGHPEYEAISLLKEYKREVLRYLTGERTEYPSLPENAFSLEAVCAAEAFQKQIQTAPKQADWAEHFPEKELMAGVSQPWKDVAQQLYRNWLARLSN